MSNAVGPVCHIPPTNQVGNPQPKDLPGLPGPISPPGSTGNPTQDAFNNALASLLNQLLAMLRQLAKQQPGQINNVVVKADWEQSERVTEKVRVYQNNDPSSPNWVDVEQINKLVMKNGKTGEKWSWSR